LGLLTSFTPCQRDRYIGNVDRHRRLRLVHGDFDALNGVIAQARQSNSVGKGFDQVQRVPFHVGSDRLRQSSVIDRLTKIIRPRCQREVQGAVHVDDESLALPALEVEDAVVTEGGDSSQADPIAAALSGSPLGVYDCVCRHATS
jgi:hypothetical protein